MDRLFIVEKKNYISPCVIYKISSMFLVFAQQTLWDLPIKKILKKNQWDYVDLKA